MAILKYQKEEKQKKYQKLLIRLLYLFIITPFSIISFCQYTTDYKGIKWESSLNWSQVKTMAKVENKYIFVDCYATWCGPCKLMDRLVYPNDTVGDIMNQKFISVRIQFDSTEHDTEEIKAWHSIAAFFKKEYLIPGFPCYLIFSPEGIMVHKESGLLSVNNFIQLIKDAINPAKQYYALSELYKKGEMQLSNLGDLALLAKKNGDNKYSNSIAADYKNNYLDMLEDSSALEKKNILFISKFPDLIRSTDKFFAFFYNHSVSADIILSNKGFSDRIVKYVILKEEVIPKLWENGKPINKHPSWRKFKKSITLKYNITYGEAIVEDYKCLFYRKIENWKKWAYCFEDKIKHSSETPNGTNLGMYVDPMVLNINAWEAFKFCNNKKILRMALNWSDHSIKLKSNAQYLDTKANLLYKLGKHIEAITLEQEALAITKKGQLHDIFLNTLNKMKQGIPTWHLSD